MLMLQSYRLSVIYSIRCLFYHMCHFDILHRAIYIFGTGLFWLENTQIFLLYMILVIRCQTCNPHANKIIVSLKGIMCPLVNIRGLICRHGCHYFRGILQRSKIFLWFVLKLQQNFYNLSCLSFMAYGAPLSGLRND